MFVNVDMCKTVLIAGVSTDSAAIFTELSKCFCEVLTIIFRMYTCMSGDRDTISGEEGGCLPYPFLKIKKIALLISKNDLIVLIHRLNVHLCSNSKRYFRSI